MSWKCPECSGTLLKVSVETDAELIQTEHSDNFETMVEGNHEWDENSRMWCLNCKFDSVAKSFEVPPEPVRVDYNPAQFRIMDRDDLYFLLSLAAREMDNTKEGDGYTEGRLAMEQHFERARNEVMDPSRHVSVVGMVKP